MRQELPRNRKDEPQVAYRAARVVQRTFLVVAIVISFLPITLKPSESMALTSATITIDGNFDDWVGVRADPDNVAFDTQVPDDPDWPGQPDRDLFYVNSTFDDDYLYFCWRRTAGGVKAITFGAYLDLDGDALLQDTDRVVVWTVSDPTQIEPSQQNYDEQGRILHYHQAEDKLGNLVYPAGDPMDHYGPPPTSMQSPPPANWADYRHTVPHGDGNTPDGWALGDPSWGEDYPTETMDAYMDPVSGIECEARVAWSDLGFGPGEIPPRISIHFFSGNGEDEGTANKTSLWPDDYRVVSGKLQESNRGQVEDNVKGLYWLATKGLSVTPDHVSGAPADTTVVYEHTITNSGNREDTFDLSVLSSMGWTVEIVDSGGDTVSEVTLDSDESATVYVRVTIPSDAPSGAEDITRLTGVSQANPNITDSATDTTRVGLVTVTPNQSGSMAPGQTIEYTYTVSNNGGTAGVYNLSTTSTLGFPNSVVDAGGNPLSSVSLASGESTTVVVRVAVPSTATVGQQDVMRLTATEQSDSRITSSSTGATLVMDGLTIAPNRTAYGGAATWVQYTHTITNSWPTLRTVSLGALSSRGWDVRIFASDGITEITEIDVGPNGATEDIVVRVFVPAGTAAGVTDDTTITAIAPTGSGTDSDSVTDHTIVRRLSTFADAGYINESDDYVIGDQVYARATGLTPSSNVYFVWKDADGVIVRTSTERRVDTQGMAFDEYLTLETDPTGYWVVELHDSGGALLETSPFNVRFDAEITALSATDAPSIGQDVAVTSSVVNHNTADINDSTVTYVIWWDSDGDGTFGDGDIYIDDTGAPVTWNGTDAVTPTHVTTGVDVAGGGTWTEATPWTVNNGQFPNQGTYNVTATWEELDGTFIDEKTSQFYSIPTLGWPLFALALFGGAFFLWRYRDRLGNLLSAEGGVAP